MSASPTAAMRAARQKLRSTLLINTKNRIERTFYIFCIPFLFLGGRLVQLQAFGLHEKGKKHSPGDVIKREIIPARRGQILAADGTAMAVTLDEYDICANPRGVNEPEKLAQLVAAKIGGNTDDYLQNLRKVQKAGGAKNYFVRVARHVDAARVRPLRELMRPPSAKETRDERTARKKFWEPVTLVPSPRRRYPLGNFASQLIGFTAGTGPGNSGLELAWHKTLAGIPGEVVSRMDAQGRPVPGMVREWKDPVPGRTLVTTIDPAIQACADRVLEELCRNFKPNFATALVMRPATGEIVAMSTAPSYNLNERPDHVVDLSMNRCLQYAYEPGSTFKIITAAAAVDKVPNWQSKSFVCNGVDIVGGKPMHCWVNSVAQRRHGVETLSDSIRDSCNFGVYGFARLVGAPSMLEYARMFKLGQRADLDGLGEVRGGLPRNAPDTWGQRQLAAFAFGQGATLTPLQLVRVAGTFANGGVMMKPMIVKELRDERGGVVQAFKPREEGRIISAATAATVTGMMERVVGEGTAKRYVYVQGYKVAGKTGSAEKVSHGVYAAGKFISSFVGFLPSRKPEFVILVMADEPHGSHWGSEVCGPAFAAIANNAMLQLRLRKGAFAPAPIPALLQRPKKATAKPVVH